MTVKRMDNVGIVVDDLEATIEFFASPALSSKASHGGRQVGGRVTGLGDQRVEVAMMRTPDGHSRIELSRFLTSPVVADHRNAPVERARLPAGMFAVDDIDDTSTDFRNTVPSSSAAKWCSTKTSRPAVRRARGATPHGSTPS